MVVERSMTGRVCVLTPRRNLSGGEETREFTAAVDEVLAAGANRVVVDLGQIVWVNSMGLAGLQRARLTCVGRGASFALARVGERIRNVLATTRLAILFDTFETGEEAVAAHGMVAARPRPDILGLPRRAW